MTNDPTHSSAAAAGSTAPTAPNAPTVLTSPDLRMVPGGNPDPYANVREAIARMGLPITLRIQPTILITGSHLPIVSTRWLIDMPSQGMVEQFCTDLDGWIRGWVAGQQQAPQPAASTTGTTR